VNGTEPTIGELVELITTDPPHRIVSGIVSGIVDATDNRRLRLRVAEGAFSRGMRVHAQRGVPDDARYTTSAVIVDPGPPFAEVQTLGEWKRVQQRQFVRLRLQAHVWAHLSAPAETEVGNSLSPAELKELNGQVLDISAGGVQLETPQPLSVGDHIVLRFELPGNGYVVESEAIVVRSDPGRHGANLNGIQFCNLSTAQETMIVRFIYEQQLRTRRHTLT